MTHAHNEFSELEGVDAGSAVDDPSFITVLLRNKKTLKLHRPGRDPVTLEAVTTSSNPTRAGEQQHELSFMVEESLKWDKPKRSRTHRPLALDGGF